MSGRTHDILISGFTLSQLEADLAAVTAERDELLQDKARLDWMLSKVDVFSRESGWELTKKLSFYRVYDTIIFIRNIEDIDEQMKLDHN
jgi:hypothetical protein